MRFGAAKSPATERPVNAKAESPAVRQTSYLPGGSMARSVLLTGVDAPVGGKPFPVLLALKEAFASPNSYQVPLKGCFALGKAEGNASSERADIQIVRMSCVLPDGKAFEQEITGYLVGEDGKQGIPGKLVDKEGRKIAFAAVAGVGAGLARAFGQQQVTNVVTDSGALLQPSQEMPLPSVWRVALKAPLPRCSVIFRSRLKDFSRSSRSMPARMSPWSCSPGPEFRG